MVLAFRLTGISGEICETRDEVLEAFNRCIGKGSDVAAPVDELPKVLILTEACASLIEEEEIEWQKKREISADCRNSWLGRSS